jgi:DNA-binding GntR family transcriptional regulator
MPVPLSRSGGGGVVRTLVEQVHKGLRDRVLAGEWHLGERIYEDTIAASLATSRAPVREAIRMLEQEGLIVRRPHRGLFVAFPSPQEMIQIASYRALLEVYAVRWGRTHTAAEAAELRALAEDMDRAGAAGDALTACNLDMAFHAVVASVTANAVLLRHYHEMDGHMALFVHALSDDDPEPLRAMGARHRALVAAIDRPERFLEAIIDHYRTAAAAMLAKAGVGTPLPEWPFDWRLTRA